MSINIAVKITGYNILTLSEEVLRYSTSGIIADIDDGELFYYYPYVKDSVVLQQVADKNQNDSISIKLYNDGSLDTLTKYSFVGRRLHVYVRGHDEVHYSLWTGKIKSVSIATNEISVVGKSNLDLLDNLINPETFTGDLETDPYDGDINLLNKPKPRVLGQVFNIEPVLLNPSRLIYGFNWNRDGTRASHAGEILLRDGGLELYHTGTVFLSTISIAKSLARGILRGEITETGVVPGIQTRTYDFGTTAAMDTYATDIYPPSPGSYYTCRAESTFMLGSPPIQTLTMDISISFRYADWVRTLVEENELETYSIYSTSDYIIGGYFTSSVSYKTVNDFFSPGNNSHLWFDSDEAVNTKLVQDLGGDPIINFVESSIELPTVDSVSALSIAKNKYSRPYTKVTVKYKKNYRPQDASSLAGKAIDDGLETVYSPKFLDATIDKDWLDVYAVENIHEIETAISETTDADLEAQRILDLYGSTNYGLDEVSITCSLLKNVDGILLGIVNEGVSDQVDCSLTTISSDSTAYTMDNDNSIFTGALKTLLVGDAVTLTSQQLSYTDARGIIVGIEVNTNKAQIIYTIQIPRMVA